MGLSSAALPYMGNIQREVFPLSVISRRRRASREVKMISMHQPVNPQVRKFLTNVCFMVFYPFLTACLLYAFEAWQGLGAWLVFPDTGFFMSISSLTGIPSGSDMFFW